MASYCKVLEVYDASIGKIAALGFYDETKPQIGMLLFNKETNQNYRIKEISMDKTNLLNRSNKTFADEFISIFDCILECNESVSLKSGEDLLIVRDHI